MEIKVDRARDPGGAKLRTLLEAHYTYERLNAVRSSSVHLLAVASVLVWVGAGWPSLLPIRVQAFALALWGGLFFVALLAGMKEWVWFCRCRRYLTEYETRQGSSAE